jgi:hypothetical protein
MQNYRNGVVVPNGHAKFLAIDSTPQANGDLDKSEADEGRANGAVVNGDGPARNIR